MVEIDRSYDYGDKDELINLIDSDKTKYMFEFKLNFVSIDWYIHENSDDFSFENNDCDGFDKLLKTHFGVKYFNESLDDMHDVYIGKDDIKWNEDKDDFDLGDNKPIDYKHFDEDVIKYLIEIHQMPFKLVGRTGDFDKHNSQSVDNIYLCKTTKALTLKEFLSSFINTYLAQSTDLEEILDYDIFGITFLNAN